LRELPLVKRNLMNRFQIGIRTESLARRGRKMKTSAVGIVSAAILMVVVGVGFGIAQAGGNHSDGPVLSFEDQVALEQSDSSSPHALLLPSAIDVDYAADGNPSSDVAQARGAVETGSLRAESNADSSIVETEGDLYLYEGKLYGIP
jgi:hypothetical protein